MITVKFQRYTSDQATKEWESEAKMKEVCLKNSSPETKIQRER